MTRIEQLLEELREVETGGEPLLTVSLDLTPGPEGIPSAHQVVKQGWRWAEERFGQMRRDTLRSYQADQQAVEALQEEAIRRGSHGLFFAGCAARDFRAVLETPYPLRNSVWLDRRSWLFELMRYHHLVQRPITVAMVDLHSIQAMRVRFGEVEEAIEQEHWQGAVTGPHGRSDTQGMGSAGADVGGAMPSANRGARSTASDFAGGWHAKTRIEKSILAHKETYARDDVHRLAELVDQEDIVLVAGPDEARAELMRQMPDGLRTRSIEAPSIDPTVDERTIADRATDLVVEQQYARAEHEVERWQRGDLGSRAITGVEGLRGAITRGQLGTAIFHEEIVPYLGTASDAREHNGADGLDAETVDELVRGALDVSAECLVVRSGSALTEQDAVLGILRWV